MRMGLLPMHVIHISEWIISYWGINYVPLTNREQDLGYEVNLQEAQKSVDWLVKRTLEISLLLIEFIRIVRIEILQFQCTTHNWILGHYVYKKIHTSILIIKIIKEFYATFCTILLQENIRSIVACRTVAGRWPRDRLLYSGPQTTEEWCFLCSSCIML
jgi:hypothetical protein